MTTIDSAARLREALERRRLQATQPEGLQRIPFQLDTVIADKIEGAGRQLGQLEDWLDELQGRLDDRDEAEVADVRATGHDLSEEGVAAAEAEAEVERLREELEGLIEQSRASEVWLVFRRASADEYEQLLIRAGGAKVETDAEAAYKFHASLVERCFVRVEVDGEDAGMSWAEFLEGADLSFGELDPIRALVYAANKRGGNSVPFSSMPSKRTRRL